MLVTSVIGALGPVMTVMFTASAVQGITEAVNGIGAADKAMAPVFGLGAVMLGVHVTTMLSGLVGSLLQLRLANHVAMKIMDHALRLEMADFEDAEVYDSLQRAQRESAMRPYQAFSEMVTTGSSMVSLVSVAAVVISWNPVVGILLLLAPVPVVISDAVFGRTAYRIEHARAVRRRELQYWQYLVTHDRTVKEIRLFGLGRLFRDRYSDTVEEFYQVDKSVQARQALLSGALGLLGIAASAMALVLAAAEAIQTGSIGSFAGFAVAVGSLRASATTTFAGLAGMFEHGLFLTNLFGFLDRRPRELSGGIAAFPQQLRHGVEFKDVSFTYPGTETKILDGVSFFLPAGASTAVVGRNGAGKSTIIKLLCRMYDPDQGQILVDERPLSDYDVDEVRASLGVIFQDFLQYEATLRENVGFGRLERMDDDAALEEAATRAGVIDLRRSLPKGWSTQLGRWFAEGKQLSGGQWQKIALSRAFVRDAAITVLDEPTASIDAAAEAEIFDRMMEVSRRSTTILVAHRFSTVRRADQILVLEDGVVTEEGTHAELMAQGGTYHQLFTLQAAGYVEHA